MLVILIKKLDNYFFNLFFNLKPSKRISLFSRWCRDISRGLTDANSFSVFWQLGTRVQGKLPRKHFKCFLKNKRSLRSLHVNGLRESEPDISTVVCFLKWYPSFNVRNVAFNQVYIFDYRLNDVVRKFLRILRRDSGRHAPGRFQGCSQCLDAVKTFR